MHYTLIGHLSKILVWKFDFCTSFSPTFHLSFPQNLARLPLRSTPYNKARTFGSEVGLLLSLLLFPLHSVQKKKFHSNPYSNFIYFYPLPFSLSLSFFSFPLFRFRFRFILTLIFKPTPFSFSFRSKERTPFQHLF